MGMSRLYQDGKEDDENEIEATDGKDEPENIAPLACSVDDEIAEERSAVRREQEEARPETWYVQKVSSSPQHHRS
jgi:hypothetical protein